MHKLHSDHAFGRNVLTIKFLFFNFRWQRVHKGSQRRAIEGDEHADRKCLYQRPRQAAASDFHGQQEEIIKRFVRIVSGLASDCVA